ncbi:type I-B CRISPR-associated protein Cas7/Cst2/DevR [Clostridioides difficile]|nr:type I-B CRISPR-associated protein Cas7/Cst2/DevR [Clostridioides difficile]
MKRGLTFTVIAQAQSLNYGEGIGNISELKKLSRADGNMYTFASRQCLRYDIVRLAAELFNWNLQVVDKEKGTIQFKDNISIRESEEMDLFGYMKTNKKDEKDKKEVL